jgi:hypothetical protein
MQYQKSRGKILSLQKKYLLIALRRFFLYGAACPFFVVVAFLGVSRQGEFKNTTTQIVPVCFLDFVIQFLGVLVRGVQTQQKVFPKNIETPPFWPPRYQPTTSRSVFCF